MGSLEELLSNINSGAVDVTVSDAVKRQPRKPKPQTDLQKRLRGQANAVNAGAAKAAGSRGAGGSAAPAAGGGAAAAAAARRPTPPPASTGAGAAAGTASPRPGGAAAAASALGGGGGGAAGGASASAAALSPNAPQALKLKRVLDWLRANREPHSAADLRARVGVDVDADPELLAALREHAQVVYDAPDRTLAYRPRIPGLRSGSDLLHYLRRHSTVEGASAAAPMAGVRMADVADAYPGVGEDVKRLAAEGAIYVFGHTVPGGETLFAVSDLHMAPAHESVVELFHATRLPPDVLDLQWRCKDLGLRSALAARPVRPKADEPGGKKRKRKAKERRFNVDKATNAHMRELFEGAQPTNIDTK